MAKVIYKSENNNKAFKDEHCYVILLKCLKWHPDPTLNVAPIRPMISQSFVEHDQPIPSGEGAPTGGLCRPDGRDKQRARNKGKTRDESSEERQERREALMTRSTRLDEIHKSRTMYESYIES
ncbi:hypothetical protein LINGRAHAP2_LOCUS27084 [Linum grandiflorum]